jgi:hypothetical protein
MSLIEFPNLPNIPGVPNIKRSASGALGNLIGVAAGTGILSQVLKYDQFGILAGALGFKWGIYYSEGYGPKSSSPSAGAQSALKSIGLDNAAGYVNKYTDQVTGFLASKGIKLPASPAINPDSIVAINPREERRIASHPVEKGQFASYNKVSAPMQCRLIMTCNGAGSMHRDEFLTQVRKMLDSIDLYDLVTPDVTYRNMNMVGLDYQRTSASGVQLLTVEATFQEVRSTATRTVAKASAPAGKSPAPLGALKAISSAAETVGKAAALFSQILVIT